MNSNSLVRSGSSQFIFQLHCSKSKPWMNFEIALLNGREHRAWFRTPSIQEGTPQARNHAWLSEHISEKAHTEARRPKAFFICELPEERRCVFESTLETKPRKDGLGCPLAYSPIGLNGQLVTSGEGHEGKGIISLAFQSHPRVPERATSK